MDNCIFCKISKKEIPSQVILEDEKFFAFLDIRPFSEGHTLVIPKKHYKYVWEIENSGEFFEFCTRIARHLQKFSIDSMVYSAVQGEGVEHAHLHLIPKHDNSFTNAINSLSPSTPLSKKELKKIGEKYKLIQQNPNE